MTWNWYRCYVRWRHGARRLPRRLLLTVICVPLLLAALVIFRLRVDSASAPLGQRKYERALALRAPPPGARPEEPRDVKPEVLRDVKLEVPHIVKPEKPRGVKPEEPHFVKLEVPRGVRPEVAALYQLPEFTCLRSGEVLPRARINDDYCDCADGTDEPGTAACVNGSFYCAGRDIPASRVGDGVCDCCDGSDEADVTPPTFRQPEEVQRRLGRFQAPCPNTCR